MLKHLHVNVLVCGINGHIPQNRKVTPGDCASRPGCECAVLLCLEALFVMHSV
jgi:hypothetical protein